MNLQTSFSCYLMSVLISNKTVLRKYRLIFELCHCFILILSTSGAASVKIGRRQILLDYNLIFVTVLCSTNGLFVLIGRFFFFLFLRMIAYFTS